MASQYERRENGDGTYSVNTAITDADGVLPIDLRDHGMNELNPLVVRNYSTVATGHSAATIRDTAGLDVVVDVSKMTGEKQIIVNTTLNQPVTMTAYAEGTGYTFAILGTGKAFSTGAGIMTSAELPGLKGSSPKIRIRLACATAPTTGSVSTFIEGVQA